MAKLAWPLLFVRDTNELFDVYRMRPEVFPGESGPQRRFIWLSSSEATVNLDGFGCDERSLVGGQPKNDIGNLLRLTDSADRMP